MPNVSPEPRLLMALVSRARYAGPALRGCGARLFLRASATWIEARAARRRRSSLPPVLPLAPRASVRGGYRPRVLVVAPYAICPAYGGTGVRVSQLLRKVASDAELHLAIFSATEDDAAQRAALAPYCESFQFLRREDAGPARPWSLRPRLVEYFAFRRATERLRDLIARLRPDIVQLEYAELAQFAPLARGARIVLEEHDLVFISARRRRALGFHERFETDRGLWSGEADLDRLLRYEVGACERADRVILMSEQDGEFLAPYLSDGWRRLRVIPNGVDVAHFRPPPEDQRPEEVLFVGSFGHTPNRDAADFLFQEIWPRVRSRRPGTRLSIVGAHPPREVRAWEGRDGVTVHGTVPDVAPYYHAHRVLAAPIRAGSGTRLKILEAFAAGVAVVSTRLGAEGLSVRDGEHLLLADDPDTFAASLCRLLDQEALRARIADSARTLAEEVYDWDASAERLLFVWHELAAEGRPRTPAVKVVWKTVEPPPVSVVILSPQGGPRVEAALTALAKQQIDQRFEVLSVVAERVAGPEAPTGLVIETMVLPRQDFDSGRAWDLAAHACRGRVLVFLADGAVPEGRLWLHDLTEPLLRPGRYAATCSKLGYARPDGAPAYWGGLAAFPESRMAVAWRARHHGFDFSLDAAAVRRETWERRPFGVSLGSLGRKWQRQILEAGLAILPLAGAVARLPALGPLDLLRAGAAEGRGWRALGEPYTLRHALRDLVRRRILRRWLRGLASGKLWRAGDLLLPWLRPWAVWWGYHFG